MRLCALKIFQCWLHTAVKNNLSNILIKFLRKGTFSKLLNCVEMSYPKLSDVLAVFLAFFSHLSFLIHNSTSYLFNESNIFSSNRTSLFFKLRDEWRVFVIIMHYWDTKSWEIACFGLSSVQLLHCSVSAVEKKVVYILKDNFRNSWNFQKILEIDSWEKMIQRKEVMITRRKRFIRNQSARITSNYFIQLRKLFWWESCKIFVSTW